MFPIQILKSNILRQEDRDEENESSQVDVADKFTHKSAKEASLTSWHTGYHVSLDMLPEYIHVRVAELILFAGKAIRVLQNPSPGATLQESMNQSHNVKVSYRMQSLIGGSGALKELPYFPNTSAEEMLPQAEADKIDAILKELKHSSEFHKRLFESAVGSIQTMAANHLWQLVVVRADLNGHLKALKDYFLLVKGDFFQCFLEESHQLMHLPPHQSTAEADLMVPFQLAALKTIGDEGKYFARVSLRYRKVFQYLIRLKRTQMELEKSWAAVMHQDHADFSDYCKDRKMVM